MAKKEYSKSEVSNKAISKNVVADNKKSTNKSTMKINLEKEDANLKQIKNSKVEDIKNKKRITDMDDFMVEDNNSIFSTLKKIWNLLFWIIFAVLACVWLVDFFRVKAEKEPIFCISKQTIEFEDGYVKECTGLGYKVYNYNRTSLEKGIEFGSFLIKMKDTKEK